MWYYKTSYIILYIIIYVFLMADLFSNFSPLIDHRGILNLNNSDTGFPFDISTMIDLGL